MLAALVVLVFLATSKRNSQPDYADAAQYIGAAWHLAEHGIFSEEPVAAHVPTGLGREPGYPFFLSVIIRLDPAWQSYDPSCLLANSCPKRAYETAIWANATLIAFSGMAIFGAAWLLTGSRLAAWLAGGHIWLNFHAFKERGYLISDFLALFLCSLLVLLLVWMAQSLDRRRSSPPLLGWAAAGLALAALTLTKAVFLYFAVPAIVAVALVMLLRGRRAMRHGALALFVFTAAFAAPVGSWMARNAALDGGWSISAGRNAIVLSNREIFNHMTPAQYAASFVYWTRGFGDDLARSLFPQPVWQPFELYDPQGFYVIGQTRLDPEIARLVSDEGMTRAQAEARLTKTMVAAILDRPMHYVATMLPLFYRGIWVDEFIVIALPGLFWLAWRGIREARMDTLAAIAPGLFNLFFYTAVSLNIPRYQVTALPTLALGFGLGLTALWGAWHRWRSRNT